MKTWVGLWGIGLFSYWVGWRLHLEGAGLEHFTLGGKKGRIKTHGYISARGRGREEPKIPFLSPVWTGLDDDTTTTHISFSLHTTHLQQHLLGCADNPPTSHFTSTHKHILVCIITSILTGRTGAILGRHIPPFSIGNWQLAIFGFGESRLCVDIGQGKEIQKNCIHICVHGVLSREK